MTAEAGFSEDDEKARSHLRILAISVSVKDLDRSLEFYETVLGFKIVQRMTGFPVAFVAPPDGAAMLVLSEGDAAHRAGTASGILFVTDDIDRQYDEWRARGLAFQESPKKIGLAARHATFVDEDGNAFELVEADVITRQIEDERRTIAERAERARQAAREIRIATQVQAGLLPRQRPVMETLDYGGLCVQARQVGGDYFDFLDFGGGRLGVVLGDVSGKGIGAALLMANLQAHIRSHYSHYSNDLAALLTSVNRLFHESSPPASYATMFFGIYDDRTRQLTYVNCGHPPALVLRHDGTAEWLESGSFVLGMFAEWSGTTRTIDLLPGDTFVLYTDGVSEAVDQHDNEFGIEAMASVCRDATGDVDAMLNALVGAVRAFGGDRQQDDITAVAARVRGSRSPREA